MIIHISSTHSFLFFQKKKYLEGLGEEKYIDVVHESVVMLLFFSSNPSYRKICKFDHFTMYICIRVDL